MSGYPSPEYYPDDEWRETPSRDEQARDVLDGDELAEYLRNKYGRGRRW